MSVSHAMVNTLDLLSAMDYYKIIFIHHSSVCSSGDIRLAGGSLDSEGRVEVCYNHQWGTVCDNGWNPVDANVACSQLGFSRFSELSINHVVSIYSMLIFM